MTKKVIIILALILNVFSGSSNILAKSKFTPDSIYNSNDIKNLALALTAISFKTQAEAIDKIQELDIKNLAVTSTAKGWKTQREAIEQIKNSDIKNLAIAITAVNFKTQGQAIDAIGK